MAGTIRRAVGLLLLLVVHTSAQAQSQTPAIPSDSDARIEFYKKRLGGPGTYPAYTRLGAAYIQKARETGRLEYYDEAERHLRRSLDLQRNFEALHWLAVVHLNRHQFREALPYAREAVETLPTSVDAQASLFDVYLALGDDAKANAVLERLLALQPGFSASARAASLQQYRGDATAALKSMQEACAHAEAESAPAEAQAWCLVRLGSLRLAACDAGRAETDYQAALKKFPNYPFAVEHLAELRATQGRTSEAARLYQQLLEANPDPLHRLALADLHEHVGQQTQADRERQQALARMRDSIDRSEKVYLRPLALRLLSDPQTARDGLRLAERDWENRQDVFAADTLAWAYFVNGLQAEARKLMDKTLHGGTRDPAVLLHAAEIYLAFGDTARARGSLKRLRSCPAALLPGDRKTLDRLWAALEASQAQ